MPTTYAIIKGKQYMDATLYTGTGATANITNTAGFLPDLTWVKSRSAATDHKLTDSVRGATKGLISDTTGAETTDSTGLTVFNTNGFTLGTSTVYNNSGATYVGWQWTAGQNTTTTNTSGTITSTVSANTTARFSIVTYSGNGTSGATVGHGLGVTPSWIIIKGRNASTGASNWLVEHSGISSSIQANSSTFTTTSTNMLLLSSTGATIAYGFDSQINGASGTYVAYCWAPVPGFSQFGSYTGNGSADGPFVYLGFRPKFIMWKNASSGAVNWLIEDSTRSTYNVMGAYLFPNLADAEGTNVAFDFLSNGFKVRDTGATYNGSGNTIIYAAFAETPFKYANAR